MSLNAVKDERSLLTSVSIRTTPQVNKRMCRIVSIAIAASSAILGGSVGLKSCDQIGNNTCTILSVTSVVFGSVGFFVAVAPFYFPTFLNNQN